MRPSCMTPNSGIWAGTPDPADDRRLHVAVLLPDGRVLITGGFTAGRGLDSAEFYDFD